MIEILIDDDNKVSLKTTNGITETEIASTTVVVLSTGLKSKMDVLFNRFDPSVVQVKVIDDKEWL